MPLSVQGAGHTTPPPPTKVACQACSPPLPCAPKLSWVQAGRTHIHASQMVVEAGFERAGWLDLARVGLCGGADCAGVLGVGAGLLLVHKLDLGVAAVCLGGLGPAAARRQGRCKTDGGAFAADATVCSNGG